jgi:proteasome assembly chaperone (PAC2) family protein
MSSLNKGKEMRDPLNSFQPPEFKLSSMVVGWDSDIGKLGEAVTNFLRDKLDGQLFHEIEPGDYFPLVSVSIEDDMVQFPESKFYYCSRPNLVIFISAQPVFEHYQFLSQVLDVAQKYCCLKEIYSIGGIASLNTHSVPRQIFGAFNSLEVKEGLSSFDICNDLDFETPVGQKPTLNSYLLWTARRRNLTAIDLSIPVPFYFSYLDDYSAQKKILEFFNRRFQIEIDLSEFDEAIKLQNKKLDNLLYIYPEIQEYLTRLESNLRLSEDENSKMTKVIEEYLKSS